MPRQVISDTNFSPLIEIFVWFGLTVSVLTVIVRVVIKLTVVKRVGPDDYLIGASLLCAIVQSISLSVAPSHGFGKALSLVNEADLDAQLKAEYAAELLFIVTCCFAKMSLLAFLRSLTRVVLHRTLGIALGASIILWTFTSIIPGAFQCGLPRPWDRVRSTCFNRIGWSYYVSIGNVVTDLGLTILPFFIVLPLKLATTKKIAVLMAFMSRLSVVAAIVVQLVFIAKRSGPTNDPSLALWPVAVSSQFAQCLSIVTACTAYLKPFLGSLESGFIQVGDLRRQRAEGYGYGSKPGSGVVVDTLASIGGRFTSKTRPVGSSYRLQHPRRPSISRPAHLVENHIGPAGNGERGDWDAHSRSRILQTRTWEVHDEAISEI